MGNAVIFPCFLQDVHVDVKAPNSPWFGSLGNSLSFYNFAIL